MSRHDYSQYSNNKNKHNNNEVTIIPETLVRRQTNAPVVEAERPAEVKMAVETADSVTLPKTVIGVVTKCVRLNVREYPCVESDIVCILDNETEIEINVDESTYEWLHICTASDIKGYCMRKFVDVHL